MRPPTPEEAKASRKRWVRYGVTSVLTGVIAGVSILMSVWVLAILFGGITCILLFLCSREKYADPMFWMDGYA